MAFKLKSGNKVSFKNMGSSPVKQDAFIPKSEYMPVSDKTKKQIADDKAWMEKRASEVSVDTSTNKEAGDVKSEWNFDFMDALKSFLSSGGGRGGLRAAAGAALTKKSPNELLAMQKAREVRKENKKKSVQERASDKFLKE